MSGMRGEILRISSDYLIGRIPTTTNSGKLILALKSNFVEVGMDVSDLNKEFFVGDSFLIRSMADLKRPIDDCKSVATEWGIYEGTDWQTVGSKGGNGVLVEGKIQAVKSLSNSVSTKTLTYAIGFVVDMKRDRALVFGLTFGLVYCPRSRFSTDTMFEGHGNCSKNLEWSDITPGTWMVIEIRKFDINEQDQENCLWFAERFHLFDRPPPVQLHYNRFNCWVTTVPALVGALSRCGNRGGVGTVWSPLIGRIMVTSELVVESGVESGDEVEIRAFLDLNRCAKKGNDRVWVSESLSRIFRRTDFLGPASILGSCPDVRLSEAKIAHKADDHGFLTLEDSGETAFFGIIDFVMDFKRAEVGSKWQVILTKQSGYANQWKALAVMPIGAIKFLPDKKMGAVQLTEIQDSGRGVCGKMTEGRCRNDSGVSSGFSESTKSESSPPPPILDGYPIPPVYDSLAKLGHLRSEYATPTNLAESRSHFSAYINYAEMCNEDNAEYRKGYAIPTNSVGLRSDPATPTTSAVLRSDPATPTTSAVLRSDPATPTTSAVLRSDPITKTSADFGSIVSALDNPAFSAGCEENNTEMQTDSTIEMKLLNRVSGDQEILGIVCRKYPELVHQMMTLRLTKAM